MGNALAAPVMMSMKDDDHLPSSSSFARLPPIKHTNIYKCYCLLFVAPLVKIQRYLLYLANKMN